MSKVVCTNCKHFGNFNGYDEGCNHKDWKKLPFQNHDSHGISTKNINNAAKICKEFRFTKELEIKNKKKMKNKEEIILI